MKIEEVNEYQDYGCHFWGKLAVVRYLDEAKNDKNWGKFGAGISLDYLEKALSLVKEKYGENIKVLLSMPELVVRVTA